MTPVKPPKAIYIQNMGHLDNVCKLDSIFIQNVAFAAKRRISEQ